MNNSGLKVAAAAVKAAANEMGISYRKCLKLLAEEGDDAFSIFYDEEPCSEAEKSRPSSGPSSLAVAVLKNIKDSNSYYMVKQYAWSIQQLNAADQAYVISGLGDLPYAIREGIMMEMKKK
jgi:hypothetical protein